MKTIYRACGYPSTKPLPLRATKDELLKLCLYSFLSTGAKDIIFLLDGVSPQLTHEFSDFGHVVDTTGMGNIGTFQKQIEMGKEFEKVFFVEDDYLWQEGTFNKLEQAVGELDFVSPYDHPLHYPGTYEMRLIGNTVYRSAPSNTLTFATTGELLKKLWPIMLPHGIADGPMFEDLNRRGYQMWNPVPSFATHLVNGLLAPNIDWDLA
jgi:hypothetical protein